MAKNYFDRYVWLVSLINRHKYISFEDISRAWAHCSLNNGDSASMQQSALPQRTFFNHIEAIYETFGIEIKCDRSRGYYIAHGDDPESDGIREWMLESLALRNLLNECAGMRDRVLFEPIPSDQQQWLSALLGAIRNGKAIRLTYQSFTREKPDTFIAHPWCLKRFRQRWYLLARSEEYKHPFIYALDRIQDVQETDKELRIPKGFNGEAFFANYFGIIVGDDCKPETVRLLVYSSHVKYIESLPLHFTQKIVEETPDYKVFEYHLVPTFDFKQEILSRGPEVEVLEPKWFRDEIREDVKAMMSRYE